MGQWFKGRIYEKRCDLSPDGTKLIYFAQKINRRTLNDPKYSYAWTAISRPPYLTALALWRKGDCWNGGGLFETNSRVWLNHAEGGGAHPDKQPRELEVLHKIDQRGEDDTVLDKRLDTESRFITDSPEIRERPSPDGRFLLRMRMTIRGFAAVYDFAYQATGGEMTPIEGAEWADWDQRGRLAFVRAGKLFAAKPSSGLDGQGQELADFNAQEPVSLKSPEWARHW
jgi:hypothetical protein